jgi:hypothetical protein
MSDENCSCLDASFSDWFYQCDVWWDRFGFEEATDYPGLPWREWYEAGLTAREAAREAHQEALGQELHDDY